MCCQLPHSGQRLRPNSSQSKGVLKTKGVYSRRLNVTTTSCDGCQALARPGPRWGEPGPTTEERVTKKSQSHWNEPMLERPAISCMAFPRDRGVNCCWKVGERKSWSAHGVCGPLSRKIDLVRCDCFSSYQPASHTGEDKRRCRL